MKRILPSLVIYAIAFASIAATPAEETPIEKFRFAWQLVKTDRFELEIVKDQDTTRMVISGGGSLRNIYLSAKDAEAVGELLKQTEAMYKKMKGSESDVSETVQAEKYKVEFRFSKDMGFRVVLAEKDATFGARVWLERDQANAAMPYLLKAATLMKKVDEKIKP